VKGTFQKQFLACTTGEQVFEADCECVYCAEEFGLRVSLSVNTKYYLPI